LEKAYVKKSGNYDTFDYSYMDHISKLTGCFIEQIGMDEYDNDEEFNE